MHIFILIIIIIISRLSYSEKVTNPSIKNKIYIVTILISKINLGTWYFMHVAEGHHGSNYNSFQLLY